MIKNEDKDIIGVRRLGYVIGAVYQGLDLIWQSVRSCFGSGVWKSKKPWKGKEKWRNHR